MFPVSGGESSTADSPVRLLATRFVYQMPGWYPDARVAVLLIAVTCVRRLDDSCDFLSVWPTISPDTEPKDTNMALFGLEVMARPNAADLIELLLLICSCVRAMIQSVTVVRANTFFRCASVLSDSSVSEVSVEKGLLGSCRCSNVC